MGKGKTRRQLLSLALGRSVTPKKSSTLSEPRRRLARIDSPRCVALTGGCSLCVERCPVEGAIFVVRNQPRIVAERCDGCALCADACPTKLPAISMLELPPES